MARGFWKKGAASAENRVETRAENGLTAAD
jgi:hypothetical protein